MVWTMYQQKTDKMQLLQIGNNFLFFLPQNLQPLQQKQIHQLWITIVHFVLILVKNTIVF